MSKMKRMIWTGKVAVITGASSGIGRATALALAQSGVRGVALGARRADALEAVQREILAAGCEALAVPTDVSCQEQVENLVGQALACWGQIDFLVVSAGQYIRAPVAAMGFEELRRSMEVNFYGAVHAVRAVLPHMLANRSGHIVLVSSMDAKKGLPPDAPYVAAKFALSGFGEVLRQELRHTGVSLSVIYPGRVDTPMIERLGFSWISAKISPEAVARAILRAVERRQAEVILPAQARLLVALNFLFPNLADWAVRFFHLEGKQL